MTTGFNVLDLMELSPLPRQIVCLLLRNRPLTHQEICARLPACADDDRAGFNSAMHDLLAKEWLTADQQSGQVVYRVKLMQRSGRVGDVWARLNVDQLAALPTLDPGLHVPSPMQRGGKRHVPENIWERLDDTAAVKPEDKLRPARWRGQKAKDLLDRVADSPPESESSSTPRSTGALDRAKLWDALDNDPLN